MKKSRIALIVLLIVLTVVLNACQEKTTNLEKLNKYISTYQTALYAGGDELFNVNVVDINQEETFLADGIVGEIKNDTTISLKVKDVNYLEKTYTYKVIGELGSVEGTMQKDKLGISFVSSLENIHDIGNITKAIISYDDTQKEFELVNVLKDAIDYNKALEISYNNFLEKIDTMLDNNTFDREIYIRVIEDKHNLSNDYYWYVSFIKNREDYFSTLVSLKGEVVTSKIMEK